METAPAAWPASLSSVLLLRSAWLHMGKWMFFVWVGSARGQGSGHAKGFHSRSPFDALQV
jgi:hypothetical protein